MVSFFLLLEAVSSTFRDFKPYLFHISSRVCCLEKCLKQLREAKNMKPLWKVKGFEKQTYHTNRQTKSHSDAQDKQTHGHGPGPGTTRHSTTRRHRNHIDLQSTARQSHCVNTILDHRNKSDLTDFVLK